MVRSPGRRWGTPPPTGRMPRAGCLRRPGPPAPDAGQRQPGEHDGVERGVGEELPFTDRAEAPGLVEGLHPGVVRCRRAGRRGPRRGRRAGPGSPAQPLASPPPAARPGPGEGRPPGERGAGGPGDGHGSRPHSGRTRSPLPEVASGSFVVRPHDRQPTALGDLLEATVARRIGDSGAFGARASVMVTGEEQVPGGGRPEFRQRRRELYGQAPPPHTQPPNASKPHHHPTQKTPPRRGTYFP